MAVTKLKLGNRAQMGNFKKVWRKINDRLSSWLLLLCHPKSYLAMDGGGEIRIASLPMLVLRFVVLSVCYGV
jgi:hypothetical protein